MLRYLSIQFCPLHICVCFLVFYLFIRKQSKISLTFIYLLTWLNELKSIRSSRDLKLKWNECQKQQFFFAVATVSPSTHINFTLLNVTPPSTFHPTRELSNKMKFLTCRFSHKLVALTSLHFPEKKILRLFFCYFCFYLFCYG